MEGIVVHQTLTELHKDVMSGLCRGIYIIFFSHFDLSSKIKGYTAGPVIHVRMFLVPCKT